MLVQLTTARCGHSYDGKVAPGFPHGRFTGVFANPPGAIVDMPANEAQNYLDRGMATLPKPDTKK